MKTKHRVALACLLAAVCWLLFLLVAFGGVL